MGLYAENYHRLARLFAPHQLAPGRMCSRVDDGLDVHLHVQERHPYTLELELTYDFVDAHTGHPCAVGAIAHVYRCARGRGAALPSRPPSVAGAGAVSAGALRCSSIGCA